MPPADPGIRSSQIAAFLGCTMEGPDVMIAGPCALSGARAGALVFATSLTAEVAASLNRVANICVLLQRDDGGLLRCTRILVDNPRLAFANVIQRFFVPTPPVGIEATAIVGGDCRIGTDVYIGHYSVIASGVEIGDHTIVEHHVTIASRVRVGRHCHIRSNTVIGGPGYGFERDDDGVPVRLPHLGGVRIGDHVEIGSLNAIARGTLEDTVIEDHAKLDDHVFIAHNVRVGRNAMVIAGAEVSGSVDVGDGAWIAPQASIKNKVKIGAGATVGLGAVVLRDVAPGTVVVGNPARPIEHRSGPDVERRTPPA